MRILVLNCGSSSIKYQLIDMETESLMAEGIVEKIGEDINNKGDKRNHGTGSDLRFHLSKREYYRR